MKTQPIRDHNGVLTGVFVPIEDWHKLKAYYPNIDKIDEDLPSWQKKLLDKRLKDLDNPDRTNLLSH